MADVLFEADDDVILWCRRPRAFRDKSSANFFEIVVLEDAFRTTLDIDNEACIEQGFRGDRGKGGPVLQWLTFGTEVKGYARHCEQWEQW